MDAARLIQLTRQRHALSQAELAARAGTSQPVISAYERGRRDPSTRTLRRLVAASGDRLELGLAARTPAIPPPADSHEHGARLVDVLLLADAVGHRPQPRPPLSFPRIESM